MAEDNLGKQYDDQKAGTNPSATEGFEEEWSKINSSIGRPTNGNSWLGVGYSRIGVVNNLEFYRGAIACS